MNIPNPFGGPITYLERTGSTMDDAANLVARGYPSGSIVMAGVQEAGRGRFQDRRWVTAPGEALLFTIAIRLDAVGRGTVPGPDIPHSLRLALGLSLYLESEGITPRIKWPNDVLVTDRKISGILVIGNPEWRFCGIGVNLVQKSFPHEDLRRPATSLLLEGLTLEPATVLTRLLPFLYDCWCSPPSWARTAIEARLWRHGEVMELVERPGADTVRGIVLGLDPDGSLRLSVDGAIRRFVTGE